VAFIILYPGYVQPVGSVRVTLYCMVSVNGWVIVTSYVSVVWLHMYLTEFDVCVMFLNVNGSVRVGGWMVWFPVRVAVIW